MFKIDWHKFIVWNLPKFDRLPNRIQWLTLLFSQIRKQWAVYVTARTAWLYDVNHTGQVIYLEKALNDAFDNNLRRIYIDDGDFGDRIFVYDRNQPLMLYWRWRQFEEYSIGHRVLDDDGIVYKSLVNNNFGVKPETYAPYWQPVGFYQWVKSRSQYTYGTGFIVFVPITLNYDESRMKALIEFRKVAGRAYQIQKV